MFVYKSVAIIEDRNCESVAEIDLLVIANYPNQLLFGVIMKQGCFAHHLPGATSLNLPELLVSDSNIRIYIYRYMEI